MVPIVVEPGLGFPIFGWRGQVPVRVPTVPRGPRAFGTLRGSLVGFLGSPPTECWPALDAPAAL
jgi:hypothetical protein